MCYGVIVIILLRVPVLRVRLYITIALWARCGATPPRLLLGLRPRILEVKLHL